MTIVIRGAQVYSSTGDGTLVTIKGDIRIEGDRIVEMGSGLPVDDQTRVIDGERRLVIPGLINAHLHSFDGFLRGSFDQLPLELWIPRVAPWFGAFEATPRQVYLRTMLVAMEAIRSGTTCVLDDAVDATGRDLSLIGEVFHAYEDIGMRANCSGGVANRPLVEALPFAKDVFPPALFQRLSTQPVVSTSDYLGFCSDAISRFHGGAGRLRFVVAPAALQWCTDDLLMESADIARAHDCPFQLHALETKVQAVAAADLPSGSTIRHLNELGILDSRTSLAHCVWVSGDEIELLASTSTSIVHNPLSNLKLGSGVAPTKKLLAKGINVALGTDNPSAGDASRMFDAMRAASLLSRAASGDPTEWLSAEDCFRAATTHGAKSMQLDSEIGTVEVGKKADLVILALDSDSFTPLNDVARQLVYCENGTSIEHVIVNGKILLEEGRITSIDEVAIREEANAEATEILSRQSESKSENDQLAPFLQEIHRRSLAMDVGVDRFVRGVGLD